MQKNKKLFSAIFIFLLVSLLFSQTDEADSSEKFSSVPVTIQRDRLPQIPKLSSYDDLFKEYSSVVQSNYKLVSAGKKPENMFFLYTNTEKFTLQGLASRCNIPYETIATLNQIESSQESIIGKEIILPTVPGMFISVQKGRSAIEVLLQENYSTYDFPQDSLKYILDGREYVFLSNKRFSPTERAFFLDSALQLPLDNGSYWVSSEFGKRKNPFSGKTKSHNGIDLAAAEGTPVYAITDGAVNSVILNDPEFGNYIILSHNHGKMTSVYAHLSKTLVEQYATVKKGDIIGYVGQTGMATGPHLHFEIRQGGKAEDPRIKLNLD